jgi:hypothetical protein
MFANYASGASLKVGAGVLVRPCAGVGVEFHGRLLSEVVSMFAFPACVNTNPSYAGPLQSLLSCFGTCFPAVSFNFVIFMFYETLG